MEPKTHNVFTDYGGLSGLLRLTCLTCGDTCLRQPYMNDQKWVEKLEQFGEAHPCYATAAQLQIAKNEQVGRQGITEEVANGT